MVFEHIEKLKQEFTDKFVVVDASRPELRRFKGQTGQVKTVNMNGRALVEFNGFANIGWYDIDLDYLTVVDKPLPEPEKKKAASHKEKTPAKPTAKSAAPPKQPSGGKTSVAETLAAARGEKSGTSAAAKSSPSPTKASAGKPESKGTNVADVLAAARAEKSGAAAAGSKPPEPAEPGGEPSAGATAAKDPSKMSISEVLAAARAEKSGAAAAGSSATEPQREASSPPAQQAEEPQAAATPARDPREMSVAEVLAAAREEKLGGGGPARAATADTAPAAETTAATETVDAAAEPHEAEPEVTDPTPEEAPAPVGDLPTDTAGILAWCRQHDGG